MNSTTFRYYFKNTGWLFVERVLRLISGLLVGVWVARYLGPENFGILSYALAIYAIFSGISNLGINQILIREILEYPEKTLDYLGTSFWLRVLSGFASFIIISSILIIKNESLTVIILVLIVSTALLLQTPDVIEAFFLANVNAKAVSICKMVQILVSGVLKIALVISGSELIFFAILSAVELLLLSIFYVFYYLNDNNKLFFKKFDLKLAYHIVKSSWPLLIGSLGFTVFSNLDVLMLKNMLGQHDAGIYMAAYKLTVLWYFFPGIVLNSVMPHLMKHRDQSIIFKNKLNSVTGILLWFAIVLSLFTGVYSDYIIRITYGNAFSKSSEMLTLLVWMNVLIFFNSCWCIKHMIQKRPRLIMYLNISTATFNFVFNIILINHFGVVGSVYASIASLIVSLFIFSIIDRETMPHIYRSITFWQNT